MKALKRWLMKGLLFFMIAVFLLMVGLTLATDDPNTIQNNEDPGKKRETVIVRIEDGEAVYGAYDEQLSKKESEKEMSKKKMSEKKSDERPSKERQAVHDSQSGDVTHEPTFHSDPSMKSYGLLDDIGRQAGDVLTSFTRKSAHYLLGGSH